jgi:uncharacterized membrane protein (UPF0127 family)
MGKRAQVVVGSDGRVVCERCGVADSFASRLRGLLGRRELPRGEGLLISPSASVHTFFMRFVVDVVFLDRSLRVVGVSRDIRPWKLTGRRGARHALELPAGESEERGIRIGEQLTLAPAGDSPGDVLGRATSRTFTPRRVS